MRFIGYAELNKGKDFPRLEASLESKPYKNKREIVRYLTTGTVELARASRTRDIFTGEIIPAEVLVMRDGDFYWSNELAWYVEKYNLRLPKDFENHILRNN